MQRHFWSKTWGGRASSLAGNLADGGARRGQVVMLLVVLLAGLGLEACSRKEDKDQQADTAQASREAAVAAQVPTQVAESVPVTETISETQLFFHWEMPPEIRQADVVLQGQRTQLKTRTLDALNTAKQDEDAAKENNFPFHRHVIDTRWWVSAETPDLLALEGLTYANQGGAHPNTILHGMVIDRSARREVTDLYAQLFSDAEGAEQIIKQGFCAELDRQRALKRQGQAGSSIGAFGACPDFTDEKIPLTLVGAVGETSTSVVRGRLAAVRAVVSPYTAGPYAEGSYIVDVPLTGTLGSLVKPQLQPLLVSATAAK